MSKRMSLVDATARKKEEFVKAAVIPEQPWEPTIVEPQGRGPTFDREDERPFIAQPVSTMRQAPDPLEIPRKKTTFNLEASLHRRLKLTAVRQDREMLEIVEEAIAKHLKSMERGVGD